MGGHGHDHGHHEPYKVPKPDIYKVEATPELIYLRDELAKRGLKDPWIRFVSTILFSLINLWFMFYDIMIEIQ